MPDDAPMLCDLVARCVSTERSGAVFPIYAPIAALSASGRLAVNLPGLLLPPR